MTCEISNIYRDCGCFNFIRPYNYLGSTNAIGWSGNIVFYNLTEGVSYSIHKVMTLPPFIQNNIRYFHSLVGLRDSVTNGYIVSDQFFPEDVISGIFGCQVLVKPDIINTNSKIEIGIDEYGIELSDFTLEEVFDKSVYLSLSTSSLTESQKIIRSKKNYYYCKVSSISGDHKVLFAKDTFEIALDGYLEKVSWFDEVDFNSSVSIPISVAIFLDGDGKYKFVFTVGSNINKTKMEVNIRYSNFYSIYNYELYGKKIFISVINDNSTPVVYMNYAGSFSNVECKDIIYSYSSIIGVDLSTTCPDNTLSFKDFIYV